ncbi:hypothetical protein YC2023_010037 [Brassica napus]
MYLWVGAQNKFGVNDTVPLIPTKTLHLFICNHRLKVKTLLISQSASSSASSWGKYGDQSSSYHTPSHPFASPAPSYNPHGNLRRILRAHGWVIHR